MKILLLSGVFSAFSFFVSPVHKYTQNSLLDSLLTAGIDQTLLQQYQMARGTFRLVARTFPDHPAGYLYQVAVLQAVSMDYESIPERGQLDSLLLLAAEKSETMIARFPQSPWGYFYRGTMMGYDSYARAQRGDWFGAATRGMSAAGDFREAIERDSLFYDAYAGIGTYYYWKTRKIEFLTWLPFIGDKREEGMRLLRMCVEHGDHNRFAAMSSLLSIYLDAEEYVRAEVVAREALRSYPENRIFLWGLATALDRGGSSRPDALDAYERLLASIVGDPRDNFYNELVCRLNLFKLRISRRDGWNWQPELDELLALKDVAFPDHLRKRAAAKFKEAEELAADLARQSKRGREENKE